MLESANHVTLPREPAWNAMLPAVRAFVLAPHPVAPA
jgi:hypothetical protein